MKTFTKRSLVTLVTLLGVLPFLTADLTPAADPASGRRAGLCAAVPAPMPLPERDSSEIAGLAATIAEAPGVSLPGLLGALGQLIVEAELSHAALSGRFEPLISTAVAGSAFALEVCRDTIVGEVSMPNRASLRFVIGDFNGDGATDVALRRPDGRTWSVDLGGVQQPSAGTALGDTPLHLKDAAQPGAGGGARCRVTWLAGRADPRGGAPGPG